MNLVSSNNNDWQFISEIIASSEGKQLENNGSSYRKFNYLLGVILDT
jgi:hypothetical protein